jgi:hypothetical protein
LFSFLKQRGRHRATASPRHYPQQQTDTAVVRQPTAEEHVIAIRKAAAIKCAGKPHGATFAVSHDAPADIRLEMEMQFIAHTDCDAPYESRDPFVYIGRRENNYTFQVI